MINLVTNQKSAFTDEMYSICTVQDSLDYLYSLESIALDTETEGFDPHTDAIISLQLGNNDIQYVIDISTVDIQLYKELIETRLILMQNAKFDLKFLFKHNIIPKDIYDTFLAERVLSTGIDNIRKSLGALVFKYCNVSLDKSIVNVIGTEGLSTRVIQYAADDVKYLHQIQKEQLIKLKELGLQKTISLDNKYVFVLAYIEYCGMYLNSTKWKAKCLEDKQNMQNIKNQLDKYILDNPTDYKEFIDNQYNMFEEGFSTKINWNSEKQVIPLMEKLGVNVEIKDKKTGIIKKSIDQKILRPQINIHSLVSLYIKYKGYQKEVSTYGENWFEYINSKTKRIHTNYTQIMNTGRLSSGQKGNKKKGISQKPNMQNVPSEDRTRNCFTAMPKNKLIVCDYSGQEQIVLANKSLDKDLLKFYKKGLGDMHSFVASKIFPELAELPLDEIKKNHKEKRQIAKGAGFAINYGGTGITIAENLSISLEKGEEVYKAYFKAFPGLANYFKKEKEKAVKLGYVQFNEISYRKSFIPFFEEFKTLHNELYGTDNFWDIYKLEKSKHSDYFKTELSPKVRKYFKKKGDIERTSLNYPIQGTSADITKLAGIYVFKYLKENNLLFKVLMPNVVHDELHLECSEDIASEMAVVLKDCMEKAGEKFCKTIALKADPCITDYWTH